MPDSAVASDTFCKVYFVDDDRGIIHSSVQWLTLSGLKVQAFADPLQLLKTVKAHEACVVVSDIRMPDLDGLGLMKHIHARDHKIPVIFITGHGDIELAVEAMKLGAYEFLTKPFSPEKLLDVIKSAQIERLKHLQTHREREQVQSVEPEKQEETSDVEQIGEAVGPLNNLVDDFEKKLITNALKKHRGDIAAVIAELDLPRRTLNAKMTKYGISRRDFR